jgi:hypothetical protein
MERWGDASQVFNGNSGARLPESLEDSGNRWAISRAEMGHAMNLRADWNDQPPGVPSVLDDQPDDRRGNVGVIHRVHQLAAKQAAIRQKQFADGLFPRCENGLRNGWRRLWSGVARATLSDSGAGGVAWVGGGAGMSSSKE